MASRDRKHHFRKGHTLNISIVVQIEGRKTQTFESACRNIAARAKNVESWDNVASVPREPHKRDAAAMAGRNLGTSMLFRTYRQRVNTIPTDDQTRYQRVNILNLDKISALE